MTLVVLHLSDIHIENSSDPILGRTAVIASTLNSYLPSASNLALIISGDIAQSGQNAEYILADQFISELIVTIKSQKEIPITIILAPGNHDCDFSGDQEARLAVVGSIAKKAGNVPESYIVTATQVQNNFFAFRKRHESDNSIVFDDQLWTTYSVEVEGIKIYFDVLNASWMSIKQEQQGGLLFPFERYQVFKPADADLRISVLHHPLNWYHQANYRSFRSFIHRLSDISLTGHEHQTGGRLIEDVKSGECAYVEGAALQPRHSLHSAFNIVTIDPETSRFRYEVFSLSNGRYDSGTDAEWVDYRPLPKREAPELDLVPTFRKILTDPGATLKHPSGRELLLDDIFVFPDFDERSTTDRDSERKNATKISSATLIQLEKYQEDVLIEGDDSAGKTRLLYRLFTAYHLQGYLPLLLRGPKIRSSAPSEVERYIDASITSQYGKENRTAFLQSSISKKVLLLDDFDLCTLIADRKSKLLTDLRRRFSRLLLTVGENYEIAEMFGGTDLFELSAFKHYRLLPLGHARRLDLIKKWNRIGADESVSNNQFLQTCDEAEQLIENTRLQHIASTVPIFVLSLLQATASGITSELHNSSFAHYYYFLVVGALEKGGVAKNDINPYIAVCTHLSWFIKNRAEDYQISINQFKEFVKRYSDEWTVTEPAALLQLLTSSKLMERDGDAIYFTYPYSYYYFLGRYASISIANPDVQEYIKYCLRHLYVRECANTLLFLAHHTGNSVVLDHVIATLADHFPTSNPVTLAKADVASVAQLLAHAPSLKYSARDPNTLRGERASVKDEHDTGDDGLQARPKENDRGLFEDLVSLGKSIEIAGALLTHQFPNYDRVTKNAAVKGMFDGALRAIRRFYSFFDDPEELINSIAARLGKRRKDLTREQIDLDARLAIGLLLRLITTSFVMKAGMHIKTKDLLDNIDGVVEANPTCAFRLIKLAQELQRPTRLPRLEIKRLCKDEDDNPCVMGVLQMLVLNRLYMFDADFDDKDWAMTTFELGGHKSKIELKHQGRYPKRLT